MNTLSIDGDSQLFTKNDKSENLIIWAEGLGGSDAYVYVNTAGPNPLHANIFSRDTIRVTGEAQVEGSLSAKTVELSGRSRLNNDNTECWPPAPEFDIRHYIEDELQTNLYSGSLPVGTLHVNLEEAYDSFSHRLLSSIYEQSNDAFHSLANQPVANNAFEDANVVVLNDSSKALSFGGFTNGTSYVGGCRYNDLPLLGWRNCLIDQSISSGSFPAVLPAFQTSDEDFKCNKNEVCYPEPGSYRKFEFDEEDSVLQTSGDVQVHYREIDIKKGPIYVNTSSPSESLLFVGHGDESRVEFSKGVKDSIINAYFYIDPAADIHPGHYHGFEVRGERNVIRGGVTAPHVAIGTEDKDTGNQFIGKAPPQCNIEETEDFFLTLASNTSIVLSCESKRVEFQITDSDGNPTGEYSGDIRITAPSSATLTLVKGEGSSGLYRADTQGRLWLDVSNSGVGTVTVVGELIDSTIPSSISHVVTFVANKFNISSTSVGAILGRPLKATVQPMECQASDDGNLQPVTSVDYLGVKSLSISTTNYLKPTINDVLNLESIQVKEISSDDFVNIPVSDFRLRFELNSKGEAEAALDLRYFESGQVSYSLYATECIIDESDEQQCETYSGVQELKVRPWTFAICSDENIDGTSGSGAGFRTTGSQFGVMVRPIVWQDGGNSSGQVETSKFCSTPVTQNFFSDSAPQATVIISHAVSTPNSDEGGIDGDLLGTLAKEHNQSVSTNDYYYFNDLVWNEAGSVRLDVTTISQYLGMEINTRYRSVGRFYPAFFKSQKHNGLTHIQTISFTWGNLLMALW
ncbi:DUF6701 domain-containing protein [Vibrio sp. T20]|uniref:DUF6701 domain-containing protein n=1 Tax=Vibrio sp. T20 TaxID=2588450 RepID=UPI0028F72CB9|nr:DUF6701 domain-containing protein [Vibrio sp. T20]